jgi:hypothetical protein
MNAKVEDKKDTKKYTDEEVEQLANDDMQSGFDRARGVEPKEEETVAKTAATEEAPPDDQDDESDVAKAAEAAQKFQEGLPERMRKLEGTIGGMVQNVEGMIEKAIKSTAGKPAAEAPSQTEISDALEDPEAMEELMSQYPAFEPIGKEMRAMRKLVAEQTSLIDEKFATSEQQQQEQSEKIDRERHDQDQFSALDTEHKGWRETIASDDFLEFALDGGPSAEDYQNVSNLYATAHANRTSPKEADDIVLGYTKQFPEWWVSKGVKIFGDIDASIQILSDFKGNSNDADGDDDKTVITDAEKEEAKRRRRLKRRDTTVIVDGKSGKSATGLTDNEAFNAGFDKVRKNTQL